MVDANAVYDQGSWRQVQHPVDKRTYALQNRIERFFNRLKHSRRIAMTRSPTCPRL